MPFAPWILELSGFLVGLLLGSFLNVCISRLPRHESLSTPRSHCPLCFQVIRWYDNVPLLSWVLLRARCRHCGQPIPGRYPLVELTTGVWFALAGRQLAPIVDTATFTGFAAPPPVLQDAWPLLIGFAVLGFLLIGLAVMDWQTHILPDAFSLPGIGIGFLLVCTQAVFLPNGVDDVHFSPHHGLRMRSPGSFAARGDVFLTGTEHLVFGRIVAILAALAIPLAIRLLYRIFRGREGMGLGDAKLLAMIAAFLGFWPAMLALFAGVLLCSGYAAVLLLRRQANAVSQLPLGSFLALGGLVAALWGTLVIHWYRGLL